jgi:hypothetical protein
MNSSRLELRPWPLIVLAYFLGPLAGLTTLWATAILIGAVLQQGFPVKGLAQSLAATWLAVMIFGGFVCLVVELIVATPILIAFNRYRWSWFNGWSAAAMGFLTGSLPTLALVVWLELDQLKSNYAPGGRLYHSLWPIDSPWGRIDLAPPVVVAIVFGAVGLIIAVVFRFVAARVAPDGPEIWDQFR